MSFPMCIVAFECVWATGSGSSKRKLTTVTASVGEGDNAL